MDNALDVFSGAEYGSIGVKFTHGLSVFAFQDVPLKIHGDNVLPLDIGNSLAVIVKVPGYQNFVTIRMKVALVTSSLFP